MRLEGVDGAATVSISVCYIDMGTYEAKWQPVLNMTVGYGNPNQWRSYVARLCTIRRTNPLFLLAIMKPTENPVGLAAGATNSNRRSGPRDLLHLRSMSKTTPAVVSILPMSRQ